MNQFDQGFAAGLELAKLKNDMAEWQTQSARPAQAPKAAAAPPTTPTKPTTPAPKTVEGAFAQAFSGKFSTYKD